jgi:hypothetical protein
LFAARTPRERMAVQLHVMRGELVAGRELLGQGVLTGISLNHHDLQVTLEVPVSRASLECLDHQVTGSRVDVALSGWLNGRDDDTDSLAMLIGMPERGGFRATRVARWISSVRRLGLTLTVVAATLLCGSVTAVVAAVPAVHTCGYFFKKGNDVIVFRSGPVSCAHATSIIRAFWSGVGVTMHGTSDATGYFTIHAWPGWRCYQAAGAGECTKHTATASYKVKGKA